MRKSGTDMVGTVGKMVWFSIRIKNGAAEGGSGLINMTNDVRLSARRSLCSGGQSIKGAVVL